MRYSLKLMGRFQLAALGGSPVEMASHRMQALVLALVRAQGRPLPRQRLRDLLWEDRGEEQGRNSLRKLLSDLRRAFEPTMDLPFRITTSDVALEPEAIVTDLEELALFDAPSAGRELAARPYAELLQGVDLPGAEFQRWLTTERQWALDLYLGAMSGRMGILEARGDLYEARQFAEAVLSADQANEAGFRILMQAAWLDGDRSAAIRYFERCRANLAAEFGVGPDQRTMALLETIRSEPAEGVKASPRRDGVQMSPLQEKPSIIVLPFDALSEEPGNQHLSDSLTDMITGELSRFHDLHVIGSRSAFEYRDREDSVSQICARLGVAFALTGSVQHAGKRVRVVAQLVDGPTGRVAWTDRLDRDLEDVLALQDELSETIAARLASGYGGQLRRAWQRSRQSTQPADMAAYECFSRAQDAIDDNWSPEGVALGRNLLVRAVDLDPGFTKARAKLAWTYLLDASEGWSADPEADILRAVKVARDAVTTDPYEPWAVWVMGACEIYAGRHRDGLDWFERAIELNPNDADLVCDYGYYLGLAGEPEAGLRATEKAMRLQPHHPSWYLMQYQQVQFDARLYAQAIATGARLRGSETRITWMLLAAAHAGLGDMANAQEALARLRIMDPKTTLSKWTDPRLLPYADATAREHLEECLSKAGLD